MADQTATQTALDARARMLARRVEQERRRDRWRIRAVSGRGSGRVCLAPGRACVGSCRH